eukprot:scaffold41170_cov31-Prasinocladus_malaysianus.AAC.1
MAIRHSRARRAMPALSAQIDPIYLPRAIWLRFGHVKVQNGSQDELRGRYLVWQPKSQDTDLREHVPRLEEDVPLLQTQEDGLDAAEDRLRGGPAGPDRKGPREDEEAQPDHLGGGGPAHAGRGDCQERGEAGHRPGPQGADAQDGGGTKEGGKKRWQAKQRHKNENLA